MYRIRSKYGGSPCFHIKDDTMIYRGTLGSPMHQFKTLPSAGTDQDPSGSYSPTEPFYEVPKYGDDDPKSSSASRCRFNKSPFWTKFLDSTNPRAIKTHFYTCR
jgi:hypothetical protein